MKIRRLVFAVIVTTVLFPHHAEAAFGRVKEDDPYAVRVRELEDRVTQMERLLENQNFLQVVAQLDSLQAEIRGLRGEIEQLRHDIDGVRQRQRDLYLDVDRRLRNVELGMEGAALNNANGTAETTTVAVAGDRDAYRAAFDLLKQARFEQAKQAFANFLQAYPGSGLVDNAQYWLAEANYISREFQQAIVEFRKVTASYPDSSKVPDALLKIGYCYYELEDWDAARNALNEVTQRFPDHAAAGLAAERLQRMANEGN
ncbi:MAG: tol-pal system protein YbgF [Gammaproteobacteria bacterium]|nr:tol-pal system protein YbgF [Gammaproteobacteria bacterium]